MLNWLFRRRGSDSMTRTPEQIALLGTLRREVIPDPAALRAELDALTRQFEAGEVEFDRLDRRGDSSAFLHLRPLAEQQQERRVRAARLPAQIESAERRENAFLDLAERCEDVENHEQALIDTLVHRPPADEDERRQVLGVLAETARLHFRMKLHLRSVAKHPRFKEPPDALNLLKETLSARVREIDRLPARTPGLKPRFAPPPEVGALLDILEGRAAARKEMSA